MKRSDIILFSMVVFSIVWVVGCSAVVKAKGYYDECRSDAACVAEMQLSGNTAHYAAERVLNASPAAAFADICGMIIGTIVALGVGVYSGRKIQKGKK